MANVTPQDEDDDDDDEQPKDFDFFDYNNYACLCIIEMGIFLPQKDATSCYSLLQLE